MDRIISFVRSDLFLSLIGGFALGVAGLAVVKPASAGPGIENDAQSIIVGAAQREPVNKTQ
nr:hypothetical protein [uncultured Sphingorhabdus sp.]